MVSYRADGNNTTLTTASDWCLRSSGTRFCTTRGIYGVGTSEANYKSNTTSNELTPWHDSEVILHGELASLQWGHSLSAVETRQYQSHGSAGFEDSGQTLDYLVKVPKVPRQGTTVGGRVPLQVGHRLLNNGGKFC